MHAFKDTLRAVQLHVEAFFLRLIKCLLKSLKTPFRLRIREYIIIHIVPFLYRNVRYLAHIRAAGIIAFPHTSPFIIFPVLRAHLFGNCIVRALRPCAFWRQDENTAYVPFTGDPVKAESNSIRPRKFHVSFDNLITSHFHPPKNLNS